jgi:Flp pilus assembly protein TadG
MGNLLALALPAPRAFRWGVLLQCTIAAKRTLFAAGSACIPAKADLEVVDLRSRGRTRLPVLRFFRNESGNVLALVAASLPLVIGAAGLATDTIQWVLWKRQLQRAADSAAMAGVYAKVNGAGYEAAVNRDLMHNNRLGVATTATPNSPPPTGPYSGDQYAVRVELAFQRKLGFSSLFMSPPTIRAGATATITPSGDYCVISLETSAVTGITVSGTASLDLGCGMITNSTAGDAAVAAGASLINASPIAAVGGIPLSSNWGSSRLLPYTLAQADPFAGIEPTLPSGSCPDIQVQPNETVVLAPGCYRNMKLQGNVTLQPGTYTLDGGDLEITAQAAVDGGAGVTFVLTSSTGPNSIGTVKIVGSSRTKLVAPSSGTYAGLVVYQDRRAVDSGLGNILAGGSPR